jgi:hypothetical protein
MGVYATALLKLEKIVLSNAHANLNGGYDRYELETVAE